MDHIPSNDVVVVQKLEWMIPSNGPDITSIHRIQSAYPDLFVNCNNKNDNILDSILCQVRLKVEKKISTTTGSGVALFDASQPQSSVTPSSPSPKNACCTNNPFTTTDFVIWTLETLNRHGEPTLPIPNSFHFASRNDKSNSTNDDNIVQHPQHELYVVFHTHEHSIPGNRPLAIGILSSLPNTTTPSIHTLRWMTSPMNFPTLRTSMLSILQQQSYKRGHVSIHFQYSLGMGCIPPPYKHTLLHGGAIQTYYLCPNVIVPSLDNAHSSDHDIDIDGKTDDVALKNDYTILNLESFQIPTIPHRLSSYDIILAYGDSVLEQLIASQRCNPNNNNNNSTDPSPQRQQQVVKKIHFGPKIASPLNPRTLVTLLDGFDTFLQPFVQCSTGDTSAKSSIAVLLNSALWDVLSDEATIGTATTPDNEQELSFHHQHNDPWEEHITTLRQYVRCIQQRYPIIQHIYWVLPTAVHIHRVHVLSDPSLLVKAPQKIARTKYMSSSRTLQLYQRQKDVIVSLMNDSSDHHVDVTCLDIYDVTYLSADWTLPGDGRHYRPELNERMLSWFY